MSRFIRSFVRRTRLMRIVRALLQNPDGMSGLAWDAEQKADRNRRRIQTVVHDVSAMSRLVQAWAKRQYLNVPWKTVGRSVFALAYFFWVADAIPDILLGIGFIDDVFVISWVLRGIRDDLERFREWEQLASGGTGYSGK